MTLFSIYVSVHWLYRVYRCLYMFQPRSSCFIPWTCKTKVIQSISLRHAVRTRLYRLHEALYHASVQESAVLYMQCTYAYIHPKDACGRWSAFRGRFPQNAYSSVCQRLYMLKPCTVMSVHEKGKMPQESWPPATGILRVYIRVCTLHIQNRQFLYTSMVQRFMKVVQAGTGEFIVKNTLVVVRYCMYMYIHHIYMYIPCMYMYI